MTQQKIPAVYMRGGTSKGVFFHINDLPEDWALRDKVLLRVIGSPDPYERQIDGLGGATSSTSKLVLIGPSSQPDCDVDYFFGAASIKKAIVDWSGNCGNLTSAVGPFAIEQDLVKAPNDGIATVRIWQANTKAKIIAHVPMKDGHVVEEGEFRLDGVAFPGAEIRIEYLDPTNTAGCEKASSMFPTGETISEVEVPGYGSYALTMMNASNPAIFIRAKDLGLKGNEMQADIDSDAKLLEQLEAIRAHAAVQMGLGQSAQEITDNRPHTPKLIFVASSSRYICSSGRAITPEMTDMNARIMSMGKLHHAMTGTGAIAIAAAAAIPDTIPSLIISQNKSGEICFGHPSGVMVVGASAEEKNGRWSITKATMSRTARRLMEGNVLIPHLA